MTPAASVLLARFRLALARRPDLLHRAPWYRVEGDRIRALAALAGIDPDRAVQAAATLSPACRWEDLMRRFPTFLAAFAGAAVAGEQDRATPPRFPGYRVNVIKAWRILAGLRGPTGPKVSRFALNLAGDDSPVTVDRWAARAAGLPESGGRAWYRTVEEAYRELARHVGIPPSRVQAILWVAVRDGIVRWGPIQDDGIAFRLFDGAGAPLCFTGSRVSEDRCRIESEVNGAAPRS